MNPTANDGAGLSWYYATVIIRIDVSGDARRVVHKNTVDDLEHGAELFWEEEVGIPDDKIAGLALPRDQLELFQEPAATPDRPNYSSVEVVHAMQRLMRGKAPEPAS